MASAAIDPRQQAHNLIDRLAPGQVCALVGLLETMLDPVARGQANAPGVGTEISEKQALAAASSKEWLKKNKGIPNEAVLAELGLKSKDLR
jgi:hypothetical protein